MFRAQSHYTLVDGRGRRGLFLLRSALAETVKTLLTFLLGLGEFLAPFLDAISWIGRNVSDGVGGFGGSSPSRRAVDSASRYSTPISNGT